MTSFRIGPYRATADWGHVVAVTVGAAFCGWYVVDTLRASTDLENVAFIVPAGLVALALYLFIVCREIRVSKVSPGSDAPPDTAASGEAKGSVDWRVPAFMVLMALFVLTMPYLGFDAAAFLFLVVGLAMHGERRWGVLLGYSAVFALLVTLFFRSMLSVDVPTLVL